MKNQRFMSKFESLLVYYVFSVQFHYVYNLYRCIKKEISKKTFEIFLNLNILFLSFFRNIF